MPTERARDERDADDLPRAGQRRLPLLGLTLRIAFASAMIAGLSLYARDAGRAPVPGAGAEAFVPATAAASPAPSAVTPARLGLAEVAFAEAGPDPVRIAAARVDPATGLREDVLARGAFEAIEAPVLRITLTRGAGASRAPGLFVLLARRAAGVPGADGQGVDGPALAVVRTGAYRRIATKFGAVETLEVTLSGPSRRACTGFVTRESAIRLDGWLCAPLGRPPEPRALACTIDALSLDDPADPAATSAFRAAATSHAPGCDRPAAMADPAGRTGSIDRRSARKRK